ncbi:MAG: hypothetical protein KC589_11245, partial [Nanoarchaeota archaeon]|nr:hypothetical protein [Nanoarchaeota archaeon]
EPPFYEGKELNFNLYFNIETEEFGYWQPVKMRDAPEWINVTNFFNCSDAADFIQKMQESEDEDISNFFKENGLKYLKTLNGLNKIREYEYYLDEDKLRPEMKVEEVVKIFNLVNKEGRKLNEADLAMAHVSMVSEEIKDNFREELESLRNRNFNFDFDFLITCLNSIVTGHGNFDNIYSKNEKELNDAWIKTKKSIDYLINILISRAYVDSSNQYELRTQYLLIPLVTYLAKNNFEFNNEKDLNKGLYWFYNAMIWGRYTRRGASSPLEQDIVSISKTNELDSLIDNLRKEVRDFKVKPSDLEGAPLNSPFFNMTFILSKHEGALDWFTGIKLHSNLNGKIYELEKHHIFPKDFLKKRGYKSREDIALINCLLNRAFLTQRANL